MWTRAVRHFSLVLVSAFGALVANASAQVVHVVNGTGAALDVAANAAASGDTLLVRGGPYTALNVPARKLTIVADVPGRVACDLISIANLANGDDVTIAGFDFALVSTISACDGAVRIESCSFHSTSPNVALWIANSSDVSLSRCQILAEQPAMIGQQSADGLWVQASTLALYDSTAEGAHGTNFGAIFIGQLLYIDAKSGGAGARIEAGSTLFASRSTFTGGDGGKGRPLICGLPYFGAGPVPGATGGDGLVCAGASVNVLDCAFNPGAGGAGGSGGQCCAGCVPFGPAATGPSGQPVNGTATTLAGVGASLAGPRIIRESNSLDLTVTGTPGDQVWVAFSAKPRWSFDPAYSGVFLYSTMLRRKYLGTIPAGGVLDASLPWGALPGGVDATLRHVQLVTRTATSAFVLSSPTHVVIVDSAY